MRLVVLKFIQGTENRNTSKMITQLELVDDSVNIKIEATETVEYFSVVLFQCTLFIHCMLCKVVLSFESERIKHLKCCFTIETKATEQYFPVGLFTTLYKVVLTFHSVDEILKE